MAIASRDANRGRTFAADLGIPRSYGGYDALLADPAVDAVYICLPNALHTTWTVRAAEAGKHVLCEKPLARRAADAERAAEACRRADVLLMEEFMWRYHPQHARVRRLLELGTIGEPRLIRASFAYLIRAELPGGRNVALRPELEGGCLMDVGSYTVNTARWLFEAEPVEVSGQQVIDPTYGVECAFGGVLRFSDDRVAVIDCAFGVAEVDRYEIDGSQGKLIVEHAYRPDAPSAPVVVVRGRERSTEELPPTNTYALEVEQFVRSVRLGRLQPPAEDGVAQARVIEALYASATNPR